MSFKKSSVLLASLVMLATLVAPIAVFAREGEDDTVEGLTSERINTTRSEKKAYYEQKAEEAKKQAEIKSAELRANAQSKTKEARSKSCEQIKNNVEKRTAEKTDWATKHDQRFDSIMSRISDFTSRKNLTVENGETLVASATEASGVVDQEIKSLQALALNVDCDDPDSAASAIEAYKVQVEAVRTALKEYRETIRSYASAVKAANSAQENS